MKAQFGFELEGFYHEDGVITIPPLGYPADNFPGLVEVRTEGGADLDNAFFALIQGMCKYPDVHFHIPSHTFKGWELTELRSRHFDKGGIKISNIYGYAMRNIGNKTLASFQVNISLKEKNTIVESAGEHPRKTHTYWTTKLLDIPTIVRGLDAEFADEIKAAKRQPGFYSIKDNGMRLEYRSLPNTVVGVCVSLQQIQRVLKRLHNVLGMY